MHREENCWLKYTRFGGASIQIVATVAIKSRECERNLRTLRYRLGAVTPVSTFRHLKAEFLRIIAEGVHQPMSLAYLEKLNPEQRRAVEHGEDEPARDRNWARPEGGRSPSSSSNSGRQGHIFTGSRGASTNGRCATTVVANRLGQSTRFRKTCMLSRRCVTRCNPLSPKCGVAARQAASGAGLSP
jgi:hypothetical protein